MAASARPDGSSPTTPARWTSAPRVRALYPGFVAPPGRVWRDRSRRMGMGASREMRPVGSPNQYSSATMSPSTSSFLPGKPSSRPRRRCLSIGITLGRVLAAGQENHFGDEQHQRQKGEVGQVQRAIQLQNHGAGAAEAEQQPSAKRAQGGAERGCLSERQQDARGEAAGGHEENADEQLLLAQAWIGEQDKGRQAGQGQSAQREGSRRD